MQKITIVVPGKPVPKGRPRVTRHGTYTPKETAVYEKLIRMCWMEQSGEKLPEGAPIRMTVEAYFPIPESYSRKKKQELPGKPHCKLPDLDNCIKSASDATQGYAFGNDSAICEIVARKLYGDKPKMIITLEAIE